MSARQLPFVIQPRKAFSEETIGTEESGQIKVQRRGYITVGEKALTQEAMKGSHAVSSLYSLVGLIAEESDKAPEKVLSDLTASPLPDYLHIWEEDAVKAVESMQLEATRRSMVHATAILISRVDSDWTMEDTMQLHPDLVQALDAFYTKEESGAEDMIEDSKESAGAEGKA